MAQLCVAEDCEITVGCVLGSLRDSEITILRRLLARLEQTMGPLRDRLKIFADGPGYWETDLFDELEQDHGIDFGRWVRG